MFKRTQDFMFQMRGKQSLPRWGWHGNDVIVIVVMIYGS